MNADEALAYIQSELPNLTEKQLVALLRLIELMQEWRAQEKAGEQ